MKVNNFLYLHLPLLVSAVPTIRIHGNKFFYDNGTQFYIKGVAYQKDTSDLSLGEMYVDPLANEAACKRDIPYLQELHTNLIRVYAIHSSKSHDACMNMLSNAGIYVLADLSSPDESIITSDPSWNTDIYRRYTSVIDSLQKYDNVLGFFAGNEVITNYTNTGAAPYIKAAIRDVKKYMVDKGYRNIPVGYSANDDADTREKSARYFACGNETERADFYGINMYEWCGYSSFKTSGYEERTKEFSDLNIPVFFSEYGCNSIRPRKFTEVEALFSEQMTDVWAGGIVYMYFEEENKYGLASVKDGKISTLEDFKNLKTRMEGINPTVGSYFTTSKTETTASCPTANKYWQVSPVLPPTPNDELCQCLEKTLSCVASHKLKEKEFGKLFATVCGMVDCSEITSNSSSFGTFSFCSPRQKLSFVMDKYYKSQEEEETACNFNGAASIARVYGQPKTCYQMIYSATATPDEEESDKGYTNLSASLSPVYTNTIYLCVISVTIGILTLCATLA